MTRYSWNRTLLRTRGLFMGREYKGKGVNVALGPMMNMGYVSSLLNLLDTNIVTGAWHKAVGTGKGSVQIHS